MKRSISNLGIAMSAERSLHQAAMLIDNGLVPPPMQRFMLVTPCRRLLRAAYGSDLRAALALLWLALDAKWMSLQFKVWDFWRYRVLCKNPDADLQLMMRELGIEGEE